MHACTERPSTLRKEARKQREDLHTINQMKLRVLSSLRLPVKSFVRFNLWIESRGRNADRVSPEYSNTILGFIFHFAAVLPVVLHGSLLFPIQEEGER